MRHFLRSRRGNVAALTAILILPLAALLGMATEGGSWFLITRAMQNAADSAVIAAATNGGNSTGGTDYVNEGKAIASSYGFINGASNATVTVSAPAKYASVTSCAASDCYRVNVTKTVPLYLIELVGYNGNAALGTTRGQQLSTVALATLKTVDAPFCLTALGTGNALRANGVPHSTIACNIQSNGDANCNGHSLTSGWSDSVSNNNDCGTKQHKGVPTTIDPYASLRSNIPAHPCATSYPDNHPSWPASNGFTNGQSITVGATPTFFCGDVKITGTVTINTPAGGGQIIIENGQLDITSGATLRTASGSGATIIFTSPTPSASQYTDCSGHHCSTTVSNYPTGGGTLDISSPTTGTWSGMAMYQDPNFPLQSLSYAGNSPTWKISGIVYLPKTNFTASGAVNKSTNGFSCFTLVVNSMLVSGTGDLFYVNAQSQCAQQGASSPTNKAYVVGALVY
jgi:Flp pilus assembly protein TadG